MKSTGIIRRVDELGRVVIPKAIREVLNIIENTPLEIQYDRNGKIILSKYCKSFEKCCFDWYEEHRPIMEKCHFMTQYGYGYTFCITPVAPDGSTRAGFAKCSKDDEWNTNIGRVAAYANAMGYDLNKMIGYEG